MAEKKDEMGAVTHQLSQVDDDMNKHANVKEANVASVALTAAMEAEKPKLWSRGMIQLYMIMGIGYLVSTLNGFDSSLMGSINAMKAYQNTFGLTGQGSSTGIIFIIYNLGQIAAFPFCGFLADGYGRRVCIAVGCALVLVGTAVQATANEMGHFIAGRFILGFGASIASAAGPAYTVELAHPAYRGTMAGMYNNFWWVGNILAGWTTYGTNLHMGNSSWAWRIPTIVQCILPTIVMALIMFFPETPRWLLAHDRREEAIAIMAKYHGNGNPNSPIVQLQLHEITEDFAVTRNDNPWWDFRELGNTKAARYRLAMVIAMAFFGQWSGNNVVSYFMPAMVKNAGITDPNKQLLINAINPIFSMIAAIYGATLLDKLGRRKMLMGGLWGGLFAYVLLTAFTATATKDNNLAYGTIVSIYLFGIFFAWGWTPLQTLYAVECLENRTRAKGSGLNFLFLNVAMVVNTYGISVGIEKIGWKLYLVYIAWICIEIALIFFFFVETAGKTLEELKEIFEAPNPRKASLKRAKVEIDDSGNIHNVHE
ncbi:general substrate transporter [Alternaria alternata]|uniref:General substrate transporter n=3 Tax=Alternaria sect. Alternaria TaxID=2499237 RepID=A0A177DQD7_ALTAL|nr:general substrate transporter [Alternaria alternata]RYN18950.1 Lactose permease [Alternaria tenuissima]KAH6843980.1 general substrate transporter [Alternaria alternata]OAG21341.1 general substrate transporter [Alternaria alternata]OWY43488.1 general substrate transporter [Alternaria alternata]RYN50099.1 Lactose permease [Alternaria tenuissima]